MSSSNSDMLGSEEEEEEGLTVTVIGGCGFLGQHLVMLLHTHGYNISRIRVLDFFPFKRELDYQPTRIVQSIIGSVTCMEDVLVATVDATTVFHLATFTDRSMFPDHKLYTMINVEGTNNVIRACQLNRVKNLVYASDISVVMGLSAIVRGDEMYTNYPQVHVMPEGPSKATAEKMILAACGTPLGGDSAEEEGSRSTLKTMVLRLVNLYGELDSFLWPRLVSLAAYNQGHVPCVGNQKTKMHMMYVGNAAWAFICAHDVLTYKVKRELCYRETLQTKKDYYWKAIREI